MKKTVILGLFVILQTFAFLGCDKGNSNSALYAQSTNDAQRFVGTWLTSDGKTKITFNANGTYTSSGDVEIGNGDYMFSNSKLITHSGTNDSADVRDYYFSINGRILVISRGSGYIWLLKQ